MNVEKGLALILVLVSCVRGGRMDAYFTTIECPNHFPELVTNLSCRLDRSSRSNATFSAEFTMAKDVTDVQGVYIFSIIRGSSINNYTAIEMDFCKALSSLQSHFLLKMVAEELRRTANFPLQCPFAMNKRYYVNRFTINTKIIPSYAPELSFKSDCLISANKRKAIQLIIHGRVVRRRSGR